MDTKKVELDPLCQKGKIAMAVTNRGQLIPCCRCDDPRTMNDPEFQKLLKVSNIRDYDSIQEILNTKEWAEFNENLKNNIGPNACLETCRKNKPEEEIQNLKVFDPNTDMIIDEQNR